MRAHRGGEESVEVEDRADRQTGGLDRREEKATAVA